MVFTTSIVLLEVSNLLRARAFYVDLLDLLPGPGDDPSQLRVSTPDIMITLQACRASAPAPRPPAPNLSIGFAVDDLAGATARLAAHGVPLRLAEDAQCRYAHFQDPDGTPLYFVEAKP